MRHDAPAAVFLLGYVCGLATPFVHPSTASVAFSLIALLAIRVPQVARFAFALACGIAISTHAAHVRERENRTAFDDSRFVTITAPLDHDWTLRNTLRVERFSVNGKAIAQPLAIYARFVPPPIAMHTTIRAEGFLHRNERGAWSLTLKSERLMAYTGELRRLDPQRWNRALTMRIVQ